MFLFFIFYLFFRCVYNSGSRKKWEKQIKFMTQSSSLSNRIYHKNMCIDIVTYEIHYIVIFHYFILFYSRFARTRNNNNNNKTIIPSSRRKKKCSTTNSKNAGNNTKNSYTNDSHDVWGIFIVFKFHFKSINNTHTSHNHLPFTIVFYFVIEKKLYMAIEITMEICTN